MWRETPARRTLPDAALIRAFHETAEDENRRQGRVSSKRHVRRKQCEGKVRHATVTKALDHIRSLRFGGKSYSGSMNAYHCEFCGGYHVGHAINQQRPGLKGRRP